jgi:hypothetical protein
MLKNLKLGTKLIMVGSILLLIPITTVGVLSVNKASKGLGEIENEQLAGVTKALSKAVDNALTGEMLVVKDLAISPDTIRAAGAVENAGVQGAQGDIASLNQKLARFAQTEGLKDNSQVVLVTDLRGVAFAASVDKYLGISFAERQYIKAALAGTASIGRPDVNKVTGELFVPVAAPIESQDGKVIGV